MLLRCTAKVLNLVGARTAGLATTAPGGDDWYANVFWLKRQKCLLIVHAGTLFSVVVAGVHKSDLMPIGTLVVARIHDELCVETLPSDRFGVLEPGLVQLAKTASRSMLGYMNDMARFCENFGAQFGGSSRHDVEALNRELRRQLHLSRQPPGYFVPIELARRT